MPRFSRRAAQKLRAENSRERAVSIVRRFRPEDADAVSAISNDSLQAANWSKKSYLEFSEANGSLMLVIETEGHLSGFLAGRQVADQAEVLNLAVQKKQRRTGQASALLQAALEQFKLRGAKSVYLEVRESNTVAIAFYEKHGFARTGLRKGYYRNPDEAAVTMTKKLTG